MSVTTGCHGGATWGHVCDTSAPHRRHVGATSRWPPATHSEAGDDGELAVVHRRGRGGSRSNRGSAARRLVVVAPTGMAGVAAGGEPRRRRLRAVMVATFPCAV